MKPTVNPCNVCGEDIPQTPGPGRIKRFCSKGCRYRDRYYIRKYIHCAGCGAELDRTGKPYCTACMQTRSQADRQLRRVRRYGLTWDHVDRMLAHQGGRCAICRCQITRETLHIDHDHACCPDAGRGKTPACGRCVRGLLCAACNKGLGMFNDNPEWLLSAADYLNPA